ncbi:MAG: 4-alpha-glucanotransferase [Oscillospiraceae bacterium]|nr:4-alpha-glucanotransferase [Oscillospiraceae bacterium]
MVFKTRQAGVLLPVFSLPSKYGIGTFGKEAYDFIDKLKMGKQSYWQVLPHGPTGFGDSPYQPYSTFAGNAYFIDLEMLIEEGLLAAYEVEECDWGSDPASVDYDAIAKSRFKMLRLAYSRDDRYADSDEYKKFTAHNAYWLEDYALYMALRDEKGKSWLEWDKAEKLKEEKAMAQAKVRLADDIEFYRYVQYLFFSQWAKLKAYANKNGIELIGDIPIYLSLDSADVWSNRHLFDLKKDGHPKEVAGCPPDAFSATGQLWGNPLYLWKVHKEENFRWWVSRMKAIFEMYDVVRIDHFRGFEKFYSIPAKDTTAENGKWKKGPGIDLFNAIKAELGDVKIIAEDLGTITPGVKKLLDETGYPGMKVMQFAFTKGVESDYLLHKHVQNCVVYAGTHDNQTSKGWFDSLTWEEKNYAGQYMMFYTEEWEKNRFIRHTLSSVANLVIIPIQDYLELGDEARVNTPGTAVNNWKWRLLPEQFDDETCRYMDYVLTLYYRDNKILEKERLEKEKAEKAAKEAEEQTETETAEE